MNSRPLPIGFGAEIDNLDLRQELRDSAKKELWDLWTRYGVLIFRRQDLTDSDLDGVASIFGQMSSDGATQTETAHRQFITNIIPGHEASGTGELIFHIGFPYMSLPLTATMLYACEVPPPGCGGDTLFANAKVAYDGLPRELKQKISQLKVLYTNPRNPSEQWAHPIAVPHPFTDEIVLFLDIHLTKPRHFTGIPGMEKSDALALCTQLTEYITNPANIYAHKWMSGDLVVWDNIKLQHARTNFDPKHRRHLKRRQMRASRLGDGL